MPEIQPTADVSRFQAKSVEQQTLETLQRIETLVRAIPGVEENLARKAVNALDNLKAALEPKPKGQQKRK